MLLILIAASISAQTDSGTIIIENFNSDSFSEWKVEGNAFGKGPSGSGDTHRMVGFVGSGYTCSAGSGEETGTGTLTSSPFKIERNTIHFLIGSFEIFFLPGHKEFEGLLSIQLLIDNMVVREEIPSEFHALFHQAWDVSDLKGKIAQIRIVDKDEREWAHIDIDEIVQSDIPVVGLPIERTLTVDKPKLNLPVKEGNRRCYLELYVDGSQIRAIDVELAEDEIDYWVVTDLSQWLGKEIQVRTKLFPRIGSDILDRISVENEILDSDDLYNEPLRSQFHFSSRRGWINDPNGLVYYDGEYHLFYQHNPFGWDHSRNDYNKTWGHAVSTDLVHWKELSGAVHPDHLGSIYSGSAVVDHNNTTGFQIGNEKPIVCVFTSAGGRTPWSIDKKFTQSLSYSNDGGRTFIKYDGNPVLENLDYINRDPKVIWHKPSGQWVIVLHFDERAMTFFTSKDLKKWEFQSEFETNALVDCPEFFQLPLDGNKNNKKWILYGGLGNYIIGGFNGKEFVPETQDIQYSYGDCFYASQTFNNIPEEDGRRIQMAWGVIPTRAMPFNMILLFPVEITLKDTEDGIRMFAYPVEEIKNLYIKDYKWNNIKLKPGENILSDIESELLDINAEFQIDEAKKFGFILNGKKIVYDGDNYELKCGEESAPLKPIDGRIRLRILADKVSIEIFANDGRIYMPIRSLPQGNERDVQIFTKGGDIIINSLVVNELKSIWK
jgi:sucrose-6-phosphate hydrolase SacC (GH32 family)